MGKIKVKGSRLAHIVIFGTSGTIVLAALYFFAGRPAFRYSDDMRKRFQSYEDQLQTAEELIHSVPNPSRAVEEMERKTEEFAETSGAKRQLSRIIQELGQSAAGRRLKVISITPKEDLKTGAPSPPAGVRKLFFEMVVNASYDEIGEYARFLSGLPGLFAIETMTVEQQDIDGSGQAQGTGMLKAVFILSTCVVGES